MPLQRRDAWIALLLTIFSAVVAFQYLRVAGLGQFYQDQFAPAVMMACTGKLENPATLNRPELSSLVEFLQQRRSTFDCSVLTSGNLPVGPMNAFQVATVSLLWAAGSIWRVTEVAWGHLFTLGAIFAGITTGAAYGVSRLFVRAPLAAAVAILFALAPAHLNMIGHLRDYSKAPFVIGLLFFSGLAIQSLARRRRFYAASAMGGFISGLGLAFRSDLVVAPAFFLLVLGASVVWRGFRTIPMAAAGGAAFILSFLVGAFPALTAYTGAGGALGHVALLGVMTPFNNPLGLVAPAYDLGNLYDDSYIAALIQMFAYKTISPPASVYFLGPEYNAISNRALVAFAIDFPADFVLRAYSAILRILDNEFTILPLAKGFEPLGLIRSYVYAPGYGIVAFFFALFLVGVRRPLSALFLLIAVAFFGGLSAVQFHTRHFFYLEIFYWLSGAIVVSALIDVLFAAGNAGRLAMGKGGRIGNTDVTSIPERMRGWTRPVLVALAIPGLALTVAWAALVGLRAYQQAHAKGMFERYLAAPRQPLELAPEERGDGVLFRPQGAIPNVAGAPAPLSGIRPNAFYLVATLDLARCPGPIAPLTIAYKTRPNLRTLSTLVTREGHAHIFFPAWNSPGFEFEGVILPSAQRACLGQLAAVTDYRSLPLPLWLKLNPDWRTERLYQTFARAPVPWLRGGREVETWRVPPDLLEGRAIGEFEIEPYDASNWEVLAPEAQANGPVLRLHGRTAPGTFWALSRRVNLPKKGVLAARGVIHAGGAAIGILNAQGAWAAMPVILPEGPFQVAIEVPETGEYKIAFGGSSHRNDIEVSAIGLVGGRSPPHGAAAPARTP